MNTPAIHQALRLERNSEELAWLCFPDSDLPEGINDLLRIAASPDLLKDFAIKNDIDASELNDAVFNFIEKVMLNEKNNNYKILGLNKFSTSQAQKFHFEMLTKIYNPETNARPGVDYYSTLINSSYQELKNKENNTDSISFSEQRKSSYSHYQAAQIPDTQVSNIKTVVALFSVIFICSMVAMTGKFVSKPTAEFIGSSTDTINIVEEKSTDAKQVSMVNPAKAENVSKPTITASSTALQSLLKEIEIAYENGNVDLIKPILANAPDLKDQTEKELNDKLVTIFEITTERKMVLFDFNWKSNAGILEGKGKFISRYQLVGEKKWLSREGIASVTAENIDNQLKVTQLILENQNIE